jgi:outer membrane receptor protein involved in Fe transport
MRRIENHARRLLLAGSAGAFALLCGHAAAAADSGTDRSGSVAAPTIEEVVVTAEKRSQNIQLVPASVSALQGGKLNDLGLSRLTDYSQYVPGLNITNGGSPGQTSVTLRGIAAVGPGSVVGYYIDDTPLGSSTNYAIATLMALDLMPYDLERFEVLRGPQGTLYGAGAMGGLIKYVLKQADTGAYSAQVGGELSNTSGGSGLGSAFRAALNAPLAQDRLAIRASVYDRNYEGYTDNVFRGDKDSNTGRQYGGRLGLTWKPADSLRVNLNAIWNRTRSDDNAVVTLGNVTTYVDNGAVFYRGEPTLGRLAGSHPFSQPFTKSIDYYSGTVNWDAPAGVTVTSATSWSRTRTHRVQDSSSSYGVYPLLFGLPEGYSDYHLDLDLKKFTQEVRAASASGGRFEWLVGGFYTHESSANHQLANVYDTNYVQLTGPVFSPFFLDAQLPSTYDEYAAFGDLTLNITDRFDVTGGVRYAHNSQDFRQILDGAILGGFTDIPSQSSESVATWSVSSRYRFTDDVMLYGKIATGYRPGGPNAALPGANPTVDSDKLTSYEAGLKSTFLDGRALFNITAYDIEWKGIQLAVNSPSCSCSYLANAGDAYSRGFELEGSFLPIEGLRLGYNAAYTKAELTSLLAGAPPLLTGFQLPGVPRWSGGLTADYAWPLNDQVRASVGAGVRYVGEQNSGAVSASDPNARNPSYTTADLRAGLSTDRFQVNFFVRNLTNKLAYLSQSPQQNPLTGGVATIDATPLEPRVFGVSVDARF